MKQDYIKPLSALIAILISSCSKDTKGVDLSGGPATITVKMNGIGLEGGFTSEGSVPVARASAIVKASAVSEIQDVKVLFGYGLVVRGTELSASETPSLRESTVKR